MLLVRSESPMP